MARRDNSRASSRPTRLLYEVPMRDLGPCGRTSHTNTALIEGSRLWRFTEPPATSRRWFCLPST